MLLSIFFVSFLTFANAGWLDGVLDLIPKLKSAEKIPEMLNLLTNTSEDALLTTMELIKKYGYNGELHKVTTSDGYILELHRITGRSNSIDSNAQKPIAFVMHGLLCDSSVWVLSGPERSLAFILADAGYDVWLGNARGNRYSHTHANRKIKDNDYWNFSWHEIGTLDLPAMIDHIVKTTGRKKMFYLGHSQGTTTFFVMASERPEYQEYIEEMYAMAPIAYCGRMKSPLLQILAQFTISTDQFWDRVGYHEFNPDNVLTNAVQQLMCAEKAVTQPICSNLMFLVTGFNVKQFDPALLPVILGHVPASAATKQLLHYAQLIKSGTVLLPGKFKQYDHGLIQNKKIYGSSTPPIYDVSKIKAPVHLYYSKNDWLANVKDVEKLHSQLGNPSGKTLIADKKFNHVDYMWAIDVKKFVYDLILAEMKKKL